MNLLTVIPLFRNKFQEPLFFFTKESFSIGSIVFIPHSSRDRSAIVINIDDIEKQKMFIRKNKIDINKITNKNNILFLKEQIIRDIKTYSKKYNFDIEKSLQKIIPKKIISEVNKLTPIKKDLPAGQAGVLGSENFLKKVNAEYIEKKLKPKMVKKVTAKTNYEKKSFEVKTIGDLLSNPKGNLSTQTGRKSLHSEKHYLADEIRNYFGEKAKTGKGSFGFYIGFFQRIPTPIIYQYWAEVKQSKKSIFDQQKLFWWKIGQYKKKK